MNAREPTAFDPIEFLEDAVAVPSDEDVEEMRTLLVGTLERHGVEVFVDEVGNVVAWMDAPDPEAGPHVVCNTHIDTVTPHVPFERDPDATVDGESGIDVIRGRGSCDAKGPLAALLDAFLTVEPDVGRLTLAVTPDEETLSVGAHELVTGDSRGAERVQDGDLFVVGEPTALDVCSAAKGRFEGTITLSGENAHAAELAGINAVAAAEGALRAVRTFDEQGPSESTLDSSHDSTPESTSESTHESVRHDPHPQLGPPKLTPTVIDGGGATNQIPAECSITVDRRSVPPETADGFRQALTDAVAANVPQDVGVEFRLTPRETPFLEAFATDQEHVLVRTLAEEATRSWSGPGDAGDVRPFTAATEASYFAPAPTVVFGPGVLADDDGAVAHADREYVRVDHVEAAGKALRATLDAFLSA